MLDESTANSKSIDGAMAPVVQRLEHIDSPIGPNLKALALDGELEAHPFAGWDGGAAVPSLDSPRNRARSAGEGPVAAQPAANFSWQAWESAEAMTA